MNNLDRQNPLDSDLPISKSIETGGLKTMTVFIIVLALHVAAIAGFVTWTKFQKDTTADVAQANASKPVTTHATDNALPAATTPDVTSSNVDGATSTSPMTPAVTTTAPVDATTTSGSVASVSGTSSTPASSPVVNPTTANANTPPVATTAPAPDSVSTATTTLAPVANSDLSGGMTPLSFYVVKAGDTLARIARHNHTTVTKLKATNNLTADLLHIGQKLTLPEVANLAPTMNAPSAIATATTPTAIPADTASAAPVATPAAPVAQPVNPVSPVPAVATATGNSPVYIVKAGDTIHKIARHYKTTAAAIMTANNITDPAKLAIGTKLKIPVKVNGKTETTTTTPASKAQVQESAPSARFVSSNVTMP